MAQTDQMLPSGIKAHTADLREPLLLNSQREENKNGGRRRTHSETRTMLHMSRAPVSGDRHIMVIYLTLRI